MSEPSRCSYCGNNPVNHWVEYIDNTITVNLVRVVRNNNASWMRHSLVLEDYIMRVCFAVLRALRLVTFTHDRAQPLSTRSMVMWEEALARGIRIEQAFFRGKATEWYRVRKGKWWHYYLSIPLPPSHTRAEVWADSKRALKRFLEEKNVRVPRGGHAMSLREAERIFEAVEKPVIVKPEIGSRGRHSLTHIVTKEELRTAFKVAKMLCHSVMVEEHLVGSVYRATCVRGEVVGILRGDPPRITGDGVRTIAECIVHKNETRHERQKAFVPTPASLEFIKRSGYTLETVLEPGKTIDLSEKIGLSYGGYSAEEFSRAHPKLKEQLTHAGTVLGVPLVGFDFISEDIEADPDTVRWGIIEANMLPFIDLHHFPVEGEPINVAAKVWELWEQRVSS
jgi:D-alanine-D-alanine ligase-like ATP-grasp enzyme